MSGYDVDKGPSVSHHKPSLTVRRRQAIGPGTMDENGIKAGVLTRIRRQASGRALPIVTSEFSLNGTGIRADLAILDGPTFYGVEIKSEHDTLKRLPSQMEGYARYFDRTELVVAPKHLHGLRDIDLFGADVWRYEALTDWQLHEQGTARKVSGQWLLHLLPAQEERRAHRRIEKNKVEYAARDIDSVRRAEFEHAFARRYEPTSSAFWSQVRGRKITVNDLKLLSRFHADRQLHSTIEQENAARWDDWAKAMQSISNG